MIERRSSESTLIPSLTGIRGVASVGVMFYHVQLLSPGLRIGWIAAVPCIARGWAAVDLFFVLSGFMLMHAHPTQFASLTRRDLLDFARARLRRVYPLNLVVLVLLGGVFAADPAFRHWFAGTGPGNLSASAFVRTALLATRWYLPWRGEVNPVTWSLSVEVVGYTAFPLFAWILMRARSATLPLILVPLCLAMHLAYQIFTHSAGVNDFSTTGAMVRMGTGLTAGMALCRIRQVKPGLGLCWAAPLSVLCVVLALVCSLVDATAVALPGLFAALVFALSFQAGVVNRMMASRVALFLGRISFPLYLVHMTGLLWLMYWLDVSAAVSPVLAAIGSATVVIVSLSLATVLHHAVERPARKWGSGASRGQ